MNEAKTAWFDRLDGTTSVVGVIGSPVRHSLSPPMHNAAFAALGLNWVYVPFEVAPANAADVPEAIRTLGLKGLNVTIPHKTAVLHTLDHISDDARLLGAVNTIIHEADGSLRGENTDGPGFMRSLAETGETVSGRSVALVGAGGSARSVGLAVCREGARSLTIVNRTVEKAQAVAELLQGAMPGANVNVAGLASIEAREAVAAADIIIDSTAVGMYPDHRVAPVVPAEWLQAGQMVCDLTYNPQDTVLLQAARSKNARTLDGTGMLIYQGAIAFEAWTGCKAPVEVMREVLLRCLETRQAGN